MKRIASLCLGLLLLTACTAPGNQPPVASETTDPAVKEIYAMDTYMTLTAYGEPAHGAVKAAAAEIERLDALWSISSAQGDIARLNASAQEAVADETLELISRSIAIHDLTGGALECTVLPLMELWGFTTQEYRVPAQSEIDALLPLVDSANIALRGNEVTLHGGSTIDLGAIAKGYTSQHVCDLLREYGVESALVNLGGNVQAVGVKPDGTPWRIAVQDPENLEEFAGVMSVENQAVITSGGYERYFEENGVVYHHILDPETGKPANSGITSCTIVSDDGTLADGLSTSLFVMGLEKASAFWRIHQDEFDTVLITDDGTMYITEGLVGKFTPEAKYENYEVIYAEV